MRPGKRLIDRAAGEAGFTVVESLVAALLLVIGVLGTLQLFDAGTRNTYRAEESQVLNDRLQAELEEVKQLPYGEIALTALPGSSADGNDPRSRVSSTTFAVNRGGVDPREMVFNGGETPGGDPVTGGAVNPGPEPFTTGDLSGEIFKFVTWTTDPNCAECGEGVMKRIVVAARIDEAPISFERRFVEIHTDVADPEATPDDNPAPPDDPTDETTANFWLTDTPCDNGDRQQTTADHLTHDTRGTCDQGLQTDGTRGAPDLMFTEAPSVDDNPTGALFDYATNLEPPAGSPADIGRMMPWDPSDSCQLQPVLNLVDVKRVMEGLLAALSLPALPGEFDGLLDLGGGTDKHLRMHTWLTPPVQGSGGVMTGRGTLELFTKTINGAVHPGQICLSMFIRREVTIPVQICVVICLPLNQVPIEVDIPVVNVGLLSNGDCREGAGLNLSHFTFSQNPWPTEWDKISVPICFAAVNSAGALVPLALPPESRLGLTLLVKRSGTEPGAGLEFMYDAVGYESRLEVETEDVISF